MNNHSPVQVQSTISIQNSWSLPLNNDASLLNNKFESQLHTYINSPQKRTDALEYKTQIFNSPKIVNQIKSNKIPSRFNHDIDAPLYMEKIKVDQIKFAEDVRKNAKDFTLRCLLAQNSLLVAEIFKYFYLNPESSNEKYIKEEKGFVEKARFENEQARKINQFDARYFYIESMIMEYEGVDCTNIEQVEKYVKFLAVARALDQQSAEIKQTYEETIAFLNARWGQLKEENAIDLATYSDWTTKLNEWLENPLRDLFISKPLLFKLSSRASYASFFAAHPELKNISAFLEKYQQVGLIQPSNILDNNNVRDALAKGENDPFASKLPIISEKAILTSTVAHEIKEAMLKYQSKNKILSLYVGNTDDMAMILHCFSADNTLALDKGSLSCFKMNMETIPYPVFQIHINPENPFVKL